MPEYILERFCHYPGIKAKGVIGAVVGRVSKNGVMLGYSIEQSWRNNEPFRSCVPDGEYVLMPHESKKHGKVFVMINETMGIYKNESDCKKKTDRFKCYFVHVGNRASDVEGCVALGFDMMFDKKGFGVTDSSEAVDNFRNLSDFSKQSSLTIFTTPGLLWTI